MNTVISLTDNDPWDLSRTITYAQNLSKSTDIENVVVIARSGGVELLDIHSEQTAEVESLLDNGVQFIASQPCANHREEMTDLIDGIDVIPDTVNELVRLQSEGYHVVKVP